MLLANVFWGYSFAEIAIAIIIIAAIVGVVYVIVTQAFHIQIPPWFITVVWICIAVVVAILAIKFIASIA